MDPRSYLGRLGAGVPLAALLLLTTFAPAAGADRDGDGLRDGFEKRWGVTSPDKPDSDGDGVVDSAEDNDRDKLGNLGEQRFGTKPGKKDSDRDGIPDGREDKDGDGRSNAREQDQRKLPRALRPTLADAEPDAPTDRAGCLTKRRQSTPKKCWFGPSGSETTVAIMGDSHALMWLPPAIRAAKKDGWRLVSLLKGGCTPVLGTMNTGQFELDGGRTCRQWRKNVYAWLRDHPVDLFILAHADSYQIVNGQGGIIKASLKPKTWKKGMRRTLDGLPRRTQAMLLGDVPRNEGNPIKCLMSHKRNISACVNRMEPRSERTIEVALRRVAAEKGAHFRTLFGKICTYDPCPLVQGKTLMWRDRHHVTATFANKLTPSVREIIRSGLASSRAQSVRRR